MAQFILPSSPSVQRQDRFDLLESDEYEVPFWDLLTAILRSESAPIVDVPSLIEALETIAVTLRGTASDVNYGLLREFMTADENDSRLFFTETWPILVDLALDLPSLFPEGSLSSLSSTTDGSVPRVVFSRRQMACLVVHQFLCSLPAHPWHTESFVDLRPWYSLTSTVHRGAVHAYLSALFTYFDRIRLSREEGTRQGFLDLSVEEWPIIFALQTIGTLEEEKILEDTAKEAILCSTRVETIYLPQVQTAPPYLGLPDGACVVSANKCIGYGASGTQEELHVGTSPEAYPAVLLAPPLTDRQVLICCGVEAMVSIRGYGRDAQLHEILPVYGGSQWRHRAMLFMDALELDVLPVEGDSLLPDIHPPSRLSRDMVLKAYNGFSSSIIITDPPYRHIVTGLWGCRTFGGNKHIKCTLQWCAAALAGVPVLKFVLAGTEEQRLFGDDLGRFVTKMQETSNVTVRQIFEILLGLKNDVEPEGIFDYVIDQLGATD